MRLRCRSHMAVVFTALCLAAGNCATPAAAEEPVVRTGSKAFTESGIRDYLLLLSISQTLRYRNASFWRFLLSGETDIAAFAARSR